MIRAALRNHVPAAPVYLRLAPQGPTGAAGISCDAAVARLSENVAVVPLHEGPVSNTGLCSSQSTSKPAFALGIDYCTLVFSNDKAQELGQTTRTILGWLFGTRELTATDLKAKQWQFYKLSAYIRGPDGECVGRIGRGGNGDTWCVSLSGAGCAYVRNWDRVVIQARHLGAHLSRVDVALDDFGALILGDIRQINDMARAGAFAPGGRGKPPRTSFHDDHGSNAGSTVYVGLKGRKQLCIYEKGKQLGDPDSPWIRCELRLWAADSVVPLEVLTRPHEFLRGAYQVLADRVPLCVEESRPEKKAREVAAHAVAATRFLREQCGPLLALMWECLGDQAQAFFRENIHRNTLPARFRGVAPDRDSLLTILRTQLGYEIAPPF